MKKVILTTFKMLFINVIILFLFALNSSAKINTLESNLNETISIQNQKNAQLADENISLKKLVQEQTRQISDLQKQTQQISDLQKQIEALKSDNQKLTDELNTKVTPPPKKPASQTSSSNSSKVAYITFDDGPSKNTLINLDTLKKYKIKATFFLTGGSSQFYRDTIKKIVENGNAIGNHTYSHNYSTIYTSVDAFKKDFLKNEDNLYSILGYRPTILRFPGGSNNTVSYRYGGKTIMDKIIASMNWSKYQYFDWNVSSTDAAVATQKKDKIIEAVLTQVKGKKHPIILLHDSAPKTTTAEALPEIIKKLKDMGYSFGTLSNTSYTVHFK